MLRRTSKDSCRRPATLAALLSALRFAEPAIRRQLSGQPHLAHGQQAVGAEPDGPWIWAHAASGGDVRALGQTLRSVRRTCRDTSIVLTTLTATGIEAGLSLLSEGVIARVSPAPTGQPSAAAAMMAVVPTALVLERLELWPVLLDAASSAGVPIVINNGRLRPQSLRAYQMAPRWCRWLLRTFDSGFMLSRADAGRLQQLLGSDVGRRISVAASSKLAVPGPGPAAIEELRLRYGLSRGRHCLVAGSVRIDEVDSLCHGLSGRPLLLVPRYPRDAPTAVRVCHGAGRTARLASGLGFCSDLTRPEVVVVDTFGELATHYGLAQWSFIGGTLVGVGGHNPVEAFAAGSAVAVGPWTDEIDALLEPFETIEAAVRRTSSSFRWPRPKDPPTALIRHRLHELNEGGSACAEAVARLAMTRSVG